MKKNRDHWIILAIFLTLLTCEARCSEYWEKFDNSVPWEIATAVSSFQNALFIAGIPKASTTSTVSVWRTLDGSSWQDIVLPAPLAPNVQQIVTNMETHANRLFFFVNETTVAVRVFVSDDGVSWAQGATNEFNSSSSFHDTITFGGNLLTFNSSGQILSTNGLGSPPTWTLLANSPVFGPVIRSLSFGTLGNRLFAAYGIQSGLSQSFLYEYTGGNNLIFRSTSDQGIIMNPGFVESSGEIFWAGSGLSRITSLNQVQSESAGIFPIPINVNNALHAITLGSQVLLRNSGIWELVGDPVSPTCASDRPRFGHPVQFQNALYVIPCEVNFIRSGLLSVTNQTFTPSTPALGTRDITVLKFSVKINFSESLSQLTVKNLGTAESNTDISQMGVYKGGNTIPEFLLTATNANTWVFPSGAQLNLEDGDILTLKISINSSARLGRSLQFSIPSGGIQASTNTFFNNAPISASSLQSIEDVSVVSDTVAAAPVPAQNQINFYYALGEISDVKIKIYDRAGRLIRELMESQKLASNRASTRWDCSGAAPGLYMAFVKISGPSGERTHKIHVVIKR